jgi:hypothetical protein
MTWMSLGPSCVVDENDNEAMPRTGSCTAIAFDPKTAGTVYVGAANGGLWKTTDAGLTWAPLLDRQVTLSVGAVAIAKNSGHIFVGTGDSGPEAKPITTGPHAIQGRGLLTSKDAGDSWIHTEGELTPGSRAFVTGYQPGRPSQPSRLARPGQPARPAQPAQPATFTPKNTSDQFVGARSAGIVVYPAAGDQHETRLVLACTRGLYESLDGGEHWTRLLIPSETTGGPSRDATSIVVDDTDVANPVLFAALQSLVARLPLRHDGLSGPSHRIFRRTGSGPLQLLTDPFSDDDADRVALALSPTAVPVEGSTARILYAAVSTSGELGGVAMSTNAGNSWTDITANLKTRMKSDKGNHNLSRHLTLAVDPTEPRTIYCGGVHLYRRKQGQTEWERIGKKDDDRLHVGQRAVAFDPHAPTPVMWLANNGGIYVSRDRGDTWGHRNRGLVTMQVHSVSSYPRGSIALSGTQHNAGQRFIGHPVWLKTNGGRGYSPGWDFSAFDTAIDPRRPHHWYLGLTHTLSRSNNAGRTFGDIGPGVYTSYYPRFVIDPHIAGRSEADVWLGDTEVVDRSGSRAALRQRQKPEDGWWSVYTPFIAEDTTITAMGFAVRPQGDHRALSALHLGLSVGHYARFDLPSTSATSHVDLDDPSEPVALISAVAADRDDQTIYAAAGAIRPAHRDEPFLRHRAKRSDTGGIAPNATTKPFSNLEIQPRFPHGDSPKFPIHVVALDPAKPDRVLVGADNRLYRSEDKGAHWRPWMDGLPFAMVTGIDIQPVAALGSPRLVRIATYGRGVWERDIEADDLVPLTKPDIYLRHHTGFTRRPEPPRPDKVPDHEKHFWEQHADLRIDTKRKTKGYRKPKSTLNYQQDGALDHIGFEMMRRDRKLRAGSDARVFLQVHNRSSVVAKNVKAWMLWAPLVADAAPSLPLNFWDFITGSSTDIDTSVWKQVGDPVTLTAIRVADPRIARWEWTVPKAAPKRIAMLAVISEPDDDPALRPVDDPFDPAALARVNKRFMLSTARVRTVKQSTSWTASDILGAIAIATVAGVVIYGTAKALSDAPPTS